MTEPRRRKPSNPLDYTEIPRPAPTPAHFQGPTLPIEEAEIEAVISTETLPAVIELPPIGGSVDAEQPPSLDPEIYSEPDVEDDVDLAYPVIEEPEHPFKETWNQLLNTEQPEDDFLEPAPGLPEQRSVIRASQASSSGPQFFSLFDNDDPKGADALAQTLSSLGHVREGQLLKVSFQIRELPNYRDQAKAYASQLRSGEVEKNGNGQRFTDAWSSLTGSAGSSRDTAIKLFRVLKAFFGFFTGLIGHKLEDREKSVKAAKPEKVLAEPPKLSKEDQEELNATLTQIKKKTTNGPHFETSLRVAAATIVDPEDVAEAEDELDAMIAGVTETFSAHETEHQGVNWHAINEYGIDVLMDIPPAEANPHFTLSTNELKALAHFPDDTFRADGVKVARSKVRSIKPQLMPVTTTDYLRPQLNPGNVAIGLLNKGGIDEKTVAIRYSELDKHLILTGMSGSGKSVELVAIALGTAANGKPIIVLDPHDEFIDDLIRAIITYCPERIKDLVIVDASDTEYPVAFNPLDVKSLAAVDGAVSQALTVLQGQGLEQSQMPRAQQYLHPVLKAMATANLDLEAGNKLGLLHVIPFLTDPEFRHPIVDLVNIPSVNVFFDFDRGTFEQLEPKAQLEHAQALIRVFSSLSNNHTVEHIFADDNRLDIGSLIDQNKILLFKLGTLDGDADAGMMLARMVFPGVINSMGIWGRKKDPDTGEFTGKGCRAIVDEAPALFEGTSKAAVQKILAQARKRDLGLIMGAQFIGQFDSKVQDEILANANTKISLKLDPNKIGGMGKSIGSEPQPITDGDLSDLPYFTAIGKIPVPDGDALDNSGPFVFSTLPPAPRANDPAALKEEVAAVRSRSRSLIANKREVVAKRLEADRLTEEPKKALLKLLDKKRSTGQTPDPAPMFPGSGERQAQQTPGVPQDLWGATTRAEVGADLAWLDED